MNDYDFSTFSNYNPELANRVYTCFKITLLNQKLLAILFLFSSLSLVPDTRINTDAHDYLLHNILLSMWHTVTETLSLHITQVCSVD